MMNIPTPKKQPTTLKVDIIGASLIVGAIIILIYGSTFPATMSLSLLSMTLLVTGLAGALFWRTLSVSNTVDIPTITYGLLAGAVIVLSNVSIVNLKYFAQVTPLPVEYYMVLIAVSEEMAIRGFLMPFFERLFGNMWIGIIASSLVWTVYHFYVSGLDIYYLLAVFIAGLVLGYIDRATQSLTPSLVAHVLNNLLVII